MKARFQPRLQSPVTSGRDSVLSAVNRLPALPSRALTQFLKSFEQEPSIETSIFGDSAAGGGLIRLVARDHSLPGNILRIGLFAGLETSGLAVLPHLSSYLDNILRRRKNLRAEIRSYPLSYPSAWFPENGHSHASLLSEFWSGSMLPEAYYLERELAVYRFNLIVALHSSNDSKFHLETSSRVIRDDLLIPVRLAVLQQFSGSTESFPEPFLKSPNSPKLVSASYLGSSSLEIALRIPPGSNPRIAAKILEELEQQYPALLAYQAFI